MRNDLPSPLMTLEAMAQINAAMLKTPGADRIAADLELKAGYGSIDGRYSIEELDVRLEAAASRSPARYGSVQQRIDAKLMMKHCGMVARVRK